MPKFVRASANNSVTPLAKSLRLPSVAAMRGPTGAFVRWRLNSSASPATPFACDPNRDARSPLRSMRANVHRDAGTTARIPDTIEYAASDSGIASAVAGAAGRV